MENIKKSKYHRYLSPLDVWAISFGCTVGWGAFFRPGSTFLLAAGPLGTMTGLELGAALMSIIVVNVPFLRRHKNRQIF